MAESKGTERPAPRTKKKIYGMSSGELDYLRPYFMGDDAGPQRFRYVLWVDIMGSQGKMLRSVRTASIPLMKLHVAALTAVKKNKFQSIDLFPVIDGIYVICEQLGPIQFFMSDVFRSMAAEFLVLKYWERSVVRGAIAYGPVILGIESTKGAEILRESDYAKSILLGMPLVQAYVAEKTAPPFGVFVHESVRGFGPTSKRPVTAVLWRWWDKNTENKKLASALLPSLDEYYDWCKVHSVSSGYPIDRIEAHRALAHEYLSEFRRELNPEMATPEPAEESDLTSQTTKRLKSKGSALTARKGKAATAKPTRAADPDGQAKRLAKKLGLNEEHVALIQPIFTDREQQILAARADLFLDPKARGMRIRNIVEECDTKIAAFLSDEQKQQLVAMRARGGRR
jgi:hypothetical protein